MRAIQHNSWVLLGLILTSGLLWMLYVNAKDRHQPEPRGRLLLAFCLGIVSFVLANVGYAGADALGAPDLIMNERPWTAVLCFAVVGPLEEGSKVLLAYLFVFRWREYDEAMDGFVYAAALSLGFACAENFYCAADAIGFHELAFTVALPITHVLFSAIWGFGISHAHFHVAQRSRRILWQAGSIVLAMIVHGLYDFLLLAYQATFITSGLALGLWVLVIWRTHLLGRTAVTRQATPGQNQGLDPKE